MTNEQAKKIVKGIRDKIECNTADIDDWAEFWGFTRDEYEEFLDMAIKALEQQPCEDAISRQAAIDALKVAYWDKGIQSAKDDPCIVDAMTDWAIRRIKELPSAQPEIIRCKDCAKREHCRTSTVWAVAPNDDWYCADAERRTDE